MGNRKILIDNPIRETLKGEFNVSYVTIRKALAGDPKTLLHVRIRERAIELGGRYGQN